MDQTLDESQLRVQELKDAIKRYEEEEEGKQEAKSLQAGPSTFQSLLPSQCEIKVNANFEKMLRDFNRDTSYCNSSSDGELKTRESTSTSAYVSGPSGSSTNIPQIVKEIHYQWDSDSDDDSLQSRSLLEKALLEEPSQPSNLKDSSTVEAAYLLRSKDKMSKSITQTTTHNQTIQKLKPYDRIDCINRLIEIAKGASWMMAQLKDIGPKLGMDCEERDYRPIIKSYMYEKQQKISKVNGRKGRPRANVDIDSAKVLPEACSSNVEKPCARTDFPSATSPELEAFDNVLLSLQESPKIKKKGKRKKAIVDNGGFKDKAETCTSNVEEPCARTDFPPATSPELEACNNVLLQESPKIKKKRRRKEAIVDNGSSKAKAETCPSNVEEPWTRLDLPEATPQNLSDISRLSLQETPTMNRKRSHNILSTVEKLCARLDLSPATYQIPSDLSLLSVQEIPTFKKRKRSQKTNVLDEISKDPEATCSSNVEKPYVQLDFPSATRQKRPRSRLSVQEKPKANKKNKRKRTKSLNGNGYDSPETCSSIIEKVPIGKGTTMVTRSLYDTMNWNQYTLVTRRLLVDVFSRSVLATHSLTGRASRAFPNLPPPKCLDKIKVEDIVQEVTKRCKVLPNLVRNVITLKCADEKRMWTSKIKEEKENLNNLDTSSNNNKENE